MDTKATVYVAISDAVEDTGPAGGLRAWEMCRGVVAAR